MKRTIRHLLALVVLASPATALAQDPASAQPDRPRLEVGAGGGVFYSGGTMPYTAGVLDARIGVRLSRNWSLEGLVHVMPGVGSEYSGFYRTQALWRFGGNTVQPFLAFGAAGEFSQNSWPEYHYTDYYTGEPRVYPAGRHFEIGPPWYPTVSIGFEKVLAPHLLVRAELTTAFGINDYGIAAAFLPAASVSIPFGHYRTGAR
jgi:hypothetical protein